MSFDTMLGLLSARIYPIKLQKFVSGNFGQHGTQWSGEVSNDDGKTYKKITAVYGGFRPHTAPDWSKFLSKVERDIVESFQ